MKFIINPACRELEPFIRTIPTRFSSEGELIFQGRNQLKRFVVNGKSLIVKSFKIPHLINRIAYVTVRSSKAFRSYTYGLELVRAGVSTPAPIACIEERKTGLYRSFYISEEVERVKEMREFCEGSLTEEGRVILQAFGIFTADMHKKGILHCDYSAGNILYRLEKEVPRFYLVDINRIRFNRQVTQEEGCKVFMRLWFTDEAYLAVARSYAAAMGYDEASMIERIRYYKNKFMNR